MIEIEVMIQQAPSSIASLQVPGLGVPTSAPPMVGSWQVGTAVVAVCTSRHTGGAPLDGLT